MSPAKGVVVGDIVYPYGSPLKLGRVLEVTIEHREWNKPKSIPAFKIVPEPTEASVTFRRLRVQWLTKDRKQTTESDRGIQRLADLIAATEKKLAGHQARMLAAEQEEL